MKKPDLITAFKKYCTDTPLAERVVQFAAQQQKNVREVIFEKGVIRIFNSYSPYLLFYKGVTNRDMIAGKATEKYDLSKDEYNELESLYLK